METNSNQIEIVQDINPDGSSFPFIQGEFDDLLYFNATEGEGESGFWVSDGTADGTRQIIDTDGTAGPDGLTALGDSLYFSYSDGVNGDELWTTDGTADGTNLLTDINPSVDGSDLRIAGEFNDQIYFNSIDGEDSSGLLWVSDGTAEGTNSILETDPNTSPPDDFIEFDGKTYFSYNDPATGDELWVSDGTAEGTNLFADLNPGADDSIPRNLTVLDGKLYFSANDRVSGAGSELWVTDGTTDGTNLVKDLNPGAISSSINSLTELDGKLYFRADDGTNGDELWVTDGTTDGTNLVKDINPGTFGSSINGLTEFNGKLYFSADGINGNELWVSNGTAGGTNLVKDIFLGTRTSVPPAGEALVFENGSSPRYFTEFNDRLYFMASNGNEETTSKIELWSTDGTTEGTNFEAELFGGIPADDDSAGGLGGASNANFFIDGLHVVGDELLFNASGESGIELFKLTVDESGDSNITGTGALVGGSSSGDISYGGNGANADTFTLELGQTEKVIADFDLEVDKLGLADGLEYEDLTFSGNTVKLGDQDLASLGAVSAESLTIDNFTDL